MQLALVPGKLPGMCDTRLIQSVALVLLLSVTSAAWGMSHPAPPEDVKTEAALTGPFEVALPVGEQQTLSVRGTEPVTVVVAPEPKGWGYYQFPGLGRWTDGRLVVSWHMAEDSAAGYGHASPMATSSDGGKTWTPHSGPPGVSGLLLPDGDRIAITTPKSRQVTDLELPEPVGTIIATYGKVPQTMYRLSDLSPELRVVHLKRLPRGKSQWQAETASLDDPQALRYSLQGLFPIVWWGDLRVLADGSILAGIYPGYRLRDDGTLDPKDGTFFYRSTDSGRSWQVRGRILYQPDLVADPKGNDRDGFTEPTYEILPDGSLLCVMRTTDGVGMGPMYASRSADQGRTWSVPRVIAGSGVLPRLLQLDNGVLVLAAGRPGVQVRFSCDRQGATWSEPLEMLPQEGHHDNASCGYTALLSTGPDRFLLVYSDFRHPTPDGPRKAIKLREFIVHKP